MTEGKWEAMDAGLWICPSCRRGTLGEQFCSNCWAPRPGIKVDPSSMPLPAPLQSLAPGPEDRFRPGLVAILGLVLLVAALGAGVVVVSRHGGRNNVTAAPPPPAPKSAESKFAPALDAAGNAVYVPLSRQLPARNTAVALPPALTARPETGPVITPDGAEAVVRAAWDLHARALSHLDVPLMAAFETGPALELDTGRCECNTPDNPFGTITQVAVSVPRQDSYPAQFFAQVATTASDKPFVAMLVFTRAAASSPWLLDVVGGFPTDHAAVTPPGVDAAGYLLPQTARSSIDPSTAHTLLANYWREAKRTGSVPPSSVFAPGKWTTDFARTLAVHHQGGIATNGLIGYYAYAADPAHDGAYVFAEGQGWEIVCSAIRVQKTYVGRGPNDGPYQDKARQNWGETVPPGVYKVIVDNEITVPCIEVPPAGSGEGVRVKGADEFTDVTTYH